MRLFSKFLLAVLVTSILTSIACAEWVYLDRRAGADSGVLERRGSDGLVDKTYATGMSYPEGIALSPDGGIIYVGDQDKSVKAFDTATGTQTALFTADGKVYSMAVDPATGDVYAGVFGTSYKGWIEKYDVSTSTVDHSWGDSIATSYCHPIDLEFYGGKLYSAIASAANQGIYSYDLSGVNEGDPTLLGSTDDYSMEALAFDPDGNLFTIRGGEAIIRKWVPTDGYATPSTVITLTRRTCDMDYFDDTLYIACRENGLNGGLDGDGEIRTVNLSSPTEVTWATLPSDIDFPKQLAIIEIPEPSTLALLASGLIGLLAYAWRKRK